MAESETWSLLAFQASSCEFVDPPNSDKKDLVPIGVDLKKVAASPSCPEVADASAPSPAAVYHLAVENGFLLAVIAPDIPIYGRGKMRKLRP